MSFIKANPRKTETPVDIVYDETNHVSVFNGIEVCLTPTIKGQPFDCKMCAIKQISEDHNIELKDCCGTCRCLKEDCEGVDMYYVKK